VRRAALLAGVLLAVGGTAASAQAPPKRLDGCLTLGGTARGVTLQLGGQLTAVGAILGHGTRGVVLANQSDRNLCEWLPLARQLDAQGLEALVFDYSGADPQADVAAGVRALRQGGATSVGLVGASVGARAVLVAGSLPGVDPSAVVSLSAETDARTGPPRIIPFVRRLRAPVLFVSARQDPWTAEARDTREQYAVAGSKHKRLLLEPGDAHGVDLLAGARGRRLTAAVLAFLHHP
jgi:dienelactone hydrolase